MTNATVDAQPDTTPERDVEVTTRLRPVTGPRNRHAVGQPGKKHVLAMFPGLVPARKKGARW